MFRWRQPPNPLKGEPEAVKLFLQSLFISLKIWVNAQSIRVLLVPPLGGGGGYFTSTASLNPLPNKLKASTSNMMAKPGINASIGLCVMMKL